MHTAVPLYRLHFFEGIPALIEPRGYLLAGARKFMASWILWTIGCRAVVRHAEVLGVILETVPLLGKETGRCHLQVVPLDELSLLVKWPKGQAETG